MKHGYTNTSTKTTAKKGNPSRKSGNVRTVGGELYAHPIANKDTMSKYSYEVGRKKK